MIRQELNLSQSTNVNSVFLIFYKTTRLNIQLMSNSHLSNLMTKNNC